MKIEKMFVTDHIEKSIEVITSLLGHNVNVIIDIANVMISALSRGNKVVVFGNGGSASDAEHFAGELYMYPVIALTGNSATITAIANDYSHYKMFTEQVKGFVKSGDVAVGISTSGKSQNVIEGLCLAKSFGAITIVLCGGSNMLGSSFYDYTLSIDSISTQKIQEAHMVALHIISELIKGGVNAI